MRGSNGSIVFSDPTKNDTDNDGIPDSEEVKMVMNPTSQKSLKFNIISSPHLIDSDWDGHNDLFELQLYGSDPLVYNKVINYDYADILIDNGYYWANEYQNEYETDVFKIVSVELGNNLYGSNYNKVEMHKEALLDFFKELSDPSDETEKKEKEKKMLVIMQRYFLKWEV